MVDTPDLHEQSAAESAPIVRRAAKFITGTSAFALWIAAIWMSISAMLALMQGEPAYVVTGVIALALACDLWVGSAPIVLRSASSWGLRKWAWVGVVSLFLALGMTTWNKISFWEGRSAQAQVRALQLSSDPAAAARDLLRAQPNARVPDAVQGELDGAIARRDAKRLEISALAENQANETRRRRSLRELGAIESQIGNLKAELATANAVAKASAEVAKADQQVLGLRQLDAVKKPQSLWLHIALAIVHEALQLVMLSFATLRIPGAVLDAEVRRVILARQIRLRRRVEMVSLAMDEVRQLNTAKGIFRRQRKHLPIIAMRRADLEAKRRIFEVEIEEKRFEAERALTLNGQMEPLPREMQIEDQRSSPPVEPAPYLRESIVRDAETGAELRKVRGHYRRMTGKKGGVRTAELVEPGPTLTDEPALALPNDPRLPPLPVNLPPDPVSELESEPEPAEAQIDLPDQTLRLDLLPPSAQSSLEDVLARGRSGELLNDLELERLAASGLIEQDGAGTWREVRKETADASE